MKLIFFLFNLLYASYCISCDKEEGVSFVSMINLISNPDKYVDKRVYVDGFFSFRKEDISLYYHKEAMEYSFWKDRVEIDIYDNAYMDGNLKDEEISEIAERYRKISGKAVSVLGCFKYDDRSPVRPYSLGFVEEVRVRDNY